MNEQPQVQQQPDATCATKPQPALSQTQVVTIAAAVTSILPLVPGVGPAVTAWAAANPQLMITALTALGAGLHYLMTFVTHKK